MATKNGFPVLENDASKLEEIEYLHKLAGAIASQTYLSNLFKPEMIGWVEQSIRDDGCPDIYEWHECAENNARAARDAEMKMERALQAMQGKEAQTLQNFETALASKAKEVESYRRLWQEKIAEFESLRNESGQWLSDRDEKIEALEATNAAQAQTILELKARLFDLLVK
jgi:hypothetical protein